MIRLLLVDDHALVRTAIRRLIADERDMRVVAEAASGEEALLRARECDPGVVLMDLNMPGMGGLEAMRRLVRMDTGARIIALSMHTDGPYPVTTMELGARGYLTKGCGREELVDAIRRVHAGERHVSPDVAQSIVLDSLRSTERHLTALTPRELSVIVMVSQGHNRDEISSRLCISPKTVSTYRSRAMRKLGATTDVELTHLSLRHGLIEFPSL